MSKLKIFLLIISFPLFLVGGIFTIWLILLKSMDFILGVIITDYPQSRMSEELAISATLGYVNEIALDRGFPSTNEPNWSVTYIYYDYLTLEDYSKRDYFAYRRCDYPDFENKKITFYYSERILGLYTTDKITVECVDPA